MALTARTAAHAVARAVRASRGRQVPHAVLMDNGAMQRAFVTSSVSHQNAFCVHQLTVPRHESCQSCSHAGISELLKTICCNSIVLLGVTHGVFARAVCAPGFGLSNPANDTCQACDGQSVSVGGASATCQPCQNNAVPNAGKKLCGTSVRTADRVHC